jgi:hypothetical protein
MNNGQLEIRIEHVLDTGETYPKIEAERFYPLENRDFSREQLQRY